jgi:hypothetical protein
MKVHAGLNWLIQAFVNMVTYLQVLYKQSFLNC